MLLTNSSSWFSYFVPSPAINMSEFASIDWWPTTFLSTKLLLYRAPSPFAMSGSPEDIVKPLWPRGKSASKLRVYLPRAETIWRPWTVLSIYASTSLSEFAYLFLPFSGWRWKSVCSLAEALFLDSESFLSRLTMLSLLMELADSKLLSLPWESWGEKTKNAFLITIVS